MGWRQTRESPGPAVARTAWQVARALEVTKNISNVPLKHLEDGKRLPLEFTSATFLQRGVEAARSPGHPELPDRSSLAPKWGSNPGSGDAAG
jgi:hypothetical protein